MVYIYSKWLFAILTFGSKKFQAMAVFPFIISRNPKAETDKVVINHEKIHFRQQLELLWLGFFLLYFLFFIYYWIKIKNRYNAYLQIPFEKEAYAFEDDFTYLKKRKIFDWGRFI